MVKRGHWVWCFTTGGCAGSAGWISATDAMLSRCMVINCMVSVVTCPASLSLFCSSPKMWATWWGRVCLVYLSAQLPEWNIGIYVSAKRGHMQTDHIMLRLHVYELTLMSGARGDGGGNTARWDGCWTRDKCWWRWHFNTWKCENATYFNTTSGHFPAVSVATKADTILYHLFMMLTKYCLCLNQDIMYTDL